MNLQNAEATFGKDSPQYVDILEIIEHYMASIDDHRKTEVEARTTNDTSKISDNALTGAFANLVIRPKS